MHTVYQLTQYGSDKSYEVTKKFHVELLYQMIMAHFRHWYLRVNFISFFLSSAVAFVWNTNKKFFYRVISILFFCVHRMLLLVWL